MKRMGSFSLLSRSLHWIMAAMLLTMLFVGTYMASTAGPAYPHLVNFHRPLGIAILILAVVRLASRLYSPVPPLPVELPSIVKLAAKASHILLYGLMITMPLVGWGMLSAGSYPISLWGNITLPPILPHNPALWGALRTTHTLLAFLFIGLILTHIGAALFHGLVRKDGVFSNIIHGREGR
ncbi:cytochrome b [Gluconobacter albidus]|uniref:cytochrome b n=1 Tax=Gluconobacter albidus TaxID=318683 RepID=UPI0030967BDA